MSKSMLIFIALLSLTGVCGSQPHPARAERPPKTPIAKPAPEDLQQRRAAVREALEAQRAQKPTDAEPTPPGKRQLSPQERQELRQQLRQQRG